MRPKRDISVHSLVVAVGRIAVLIIKGLWAIPWVTTALLMTLVVGMSTHWIAVPWKKRNPGKRSPFAFVQRAFAVFLRWCIYFPAGIRLRFNTDQCPSFHDSQPTVGLCVHGSLTGMFMQAYACSRDFPEPMRWVVKRESMDWPFGKGLDAMDGAVVIDRDDRASAIAAIDQAATARDGTIMLMVEGTRPTQERIALGQQLLRERGRPDLAARMLHTRPPKRDGALTLLNARPTARRVLVICFSHVHEEGFIGTLRMVLGGTVYVKYVDISSYHLPLHDPEAFARAMNELWASINDYIGAVRASGNIGLPVVLPDQAAA